MIGFVLAPLVFAIVCWLIWWIYIEPLIKLCRWVTARLRRWRTGG